MKDCIGIIFGSLLLFVTAVSLQAAELNTDSNKVNLTEPSSETIHKQVKKSETNFIDDNGPWLAALIIGLTSAIVNIVVARQLMRSNSHNIRKQLDSNEENVRMQFKATLGTQNRQNWIDEVRQSLSAYLSQAETFAIYMNGDSEKIIKYFEKIMFSRCKLLLLLNRKDNLQERLIVCIDDYWDAATDKESKSHEKVVEQRSKLIDCASQLFKVHWEKIKNLE